MTGIMGGKRVGYTLAEVLVIIGVLGVIAAISLPTLVKHIPSKEEELHKKATYQIEQAVAQMYDDTSMYFRKPGFENQAFRNTDKVIFGGQEYGGQTGEVDEDNKRNTKFCKLFITKFNSAGPNNCNGADAATLTFRTMDGIEWYIPRTNFNNVGVASANGSAAMIKIDVNGSESGSNCSNASESVRRQLKGATRARARVREIRKCNPPFDKEDIFAYYVQSNGAVSQNNTNLIQADSNKPKVVVNYRIYDRNGRIYPVDFMGAVTIVNETTGAAYNGTRTAQTNNTPGKFVFDRNLVADTTYSLHLGFSPNPFNNGSKFFSNWPNNTKVFKFTGKDTTFDFMLTQQQSKSITIKVVGSTNYSSVITGTTLSKDCKYISNGIGNNDPVYVHSTPNDDFSDYVYMGVGPNPKGYNSVRHGSLYKYSCSAANPTISYSGNKATISNLEPGDYKVVLNAKSGMQFEPGETTNYTQNIRMGTEDLTIEVNVVPN